MRKILAGSLACLLFTATTANAIIVHTANVETGSRLNASQSGIFGAGTLADNTRVLYDDVPIQAALVGAATSLDVTRITVGIRQLANAPATDVSLFWSTFTTTVVAPDSNLDTPGNFVATQPLAGSLVAVTSLMTFGDGITTMFNAPLNTTLFAGGIGAFSVGLRFSNTSNLNGWRVATPAPTFLNSGTGWIHDAAGTLGIAGNPAEVTFNLGAPPNPPATFYLIVEGNLVPEPGSLGLLTLGALAIVRRRRK